MDGAQRRPPVTGEQRIGTLNGCEKLDLKCRKILAPLQGADDLINTMSGGLRPPATFSQPGGLPSRRINPYSEYETASFVRTGPDHLADRLSASSSSSQATRATISG